MEQPFVFVMGVMVSLHIYLRAIHCCSDRLELKKMAKDYKTFSDKSRSIVGQYIWRSPM